MFFKLIYKKINVRRKTGWKFGFSRTAEIVNYAGKITIFCSAINCGDSEPFFKTEITMKL